MINIKKLLPIILFVFVLVLLIGAFTFLRPQERPKEIFRGSEDYQQVQKIEDVPGIKNVERFSDVKKRKNVTLESNKSKARVRPTPTPLPYPRISINYTRSSVSSIREKNAEKNYTFIIVSLDIRNYGYKYIDAHPRKFRLYVETDYQQYQEYQPTVSINTGNMLEEVITNNSRTKGDLVFLIKKDKRTRKTQLRYIEDNNYVVLYNQKRR